MTTRPPPTLYVNALRLPPELARLVHAGRWKDPIDVAPLRRRFPEAFDPGLPRLTPWSLTLMQGELVALMKVRKQSAEQRTMFLGRPDPDAPPGDLDPARSVLIADLGHGSDQPIALDYRVTSDDPRVLTLRWGPHAARPFGHLNRWIEIAPIFREFANLLGLYSNQ